VVGDAIDPAVAKAVIDRIVAEAGPPAVLVNTLGVFTTGDALAATVSPEAIAEVIAFLAGDTSAPVGGAILPAYGA
jgi:NAD(P)-dependent dehydrogenase (short-subunit alcohol dehydrogenase family)